MTIHSEFWKQRREVGNVLCFGSPLSTVRDSNRQRCYNAEFRELRPLQTSFDRQAAKGYARLCVKIAIRKMRETGLIKNDIVADAVRDSFKAAFTTETIGHCNAGCHGAYFAKWGWTDCVIAHEVAHWADQWAQKLAGSPGQRVSYEPHGPKWRGWFALLFGTAGIKSTPAMIDQIGFVCRVFTKEESQISTWWQNTCFVFRGDSPWQDEGFIKNHADRMFEVLPRPSQKVPGLVAYFDSVEKRARGILAMSKPGKFLKKFFGDVLNEEEIHALALKWHNKYAPRKLELATTADDIETLYRGAYLGSCMHFGSGSWSGTQHPARIFAGPDLAQAYIGELGKADARCLVWPEKKIYFPKFYGDGPRLVTALNAAGYREGSAREFYGARLQRSKLPNSKRFDLPYLDMSEHVRDDGEYLVIDPTGAVFARLTCGRSGEVLECADCGEQIVHGEHTNVVGLGPVCEHCRDENYFECEGTGEWYPLDDRATVGEDISEYGQYSEQFAHRRVDAGRWFICPVDDLYHYISNSVLHTDGVLYYTENVPSEDEEEAA